MQVLSREVFEGNRPLTVDEFLYCYKPSEINQSLDFYQFTTRGKDYRLIKSLVTSDRNWKMQFFFVSGFWAGHPIEVDRDPFPPYTEELGNLRPEGMFVPTLLFNFHFYLLMMLGWSVGWNCLRHYQRLLSSPEIKDKSKATGGGRPKILRW